MSTLLCMRRGGDQRVVRYRRDVDPLLLWYVDGFAVVHCGREIGTVELVLPTLEGDLPGSVVLKTCDGAGGLFQTDAIDAVRFREREISVTAEPAPFDLAEASSRARYPASA